MKTKIKPVPNNLHTVNEDYIDSLHAAAIIATNTGTKIRKIVTRTARVIENHKTTGQRIHRTFKFGY